MEDQCENIQNLSLRLNFSTNNDSVWCESESELYCRIRLLVCVENLKVNLNQKNLELKYIVLKYIYSRFNKFCYIRKFLGTK